MLIMARRIKLRLKNRQQQQQKIKIQVQMSGYNQNDQQVFSQQQDAECIQLKQKIYVKPNQLHLLINDRQKFLSTILNILNHAKHKIDINQKQQLKFALIYLKQSQRIVEYAASSGKTINKQLIIHILHNQASIYQKLWELINCSNYLEGIIYNYEQFIRQTSNHSQVLAKEAGGVGGGGSGSEIMIVDPTKFKMKQKLARYNLQFCAINSQIANHDTALLSIKKASNLMLQTIKGTIQQFKRQINTQYNQDISKTHLRLGLFLGLAHYQKMFQDKHDFSELNKSMLKSTHFALQIWLEEKKLGNLRSKDNKDYIQYLNNYSIGNIVQITSLKFDETEIGIFSIMKQKINMLLIDRQFHFHNKIILLSTCMFSKATQLRLKSFQIYINHPQQRKLSKQYKLSINYHLLAIMIIAIAIPYNLKYMNEIILSYQKHYGVNLMEYKTVEEESMDKIMEILKIDVGEYERLVFSEKFRSVKVSQTNNSNNNRQSEESYPKNDYNLKSNFEIDKIKKHQKLKKLKKITNQLTSSYKNGDSNSKLKHLNNKSKEYKTSISINKNNLKERNMSKNDSLKKMMNFQQKCQWFKDKEIHSSNKYSKEKNQNHRERQMKMNNQVKKGKNDNRKSRDIEGKKSKSKSKHIIDETEELFFCFTKKTKKTRGIASPPANMRGSLNRSSSIKSKEQNKKSGLMTPRNMKIHTVKFPKNSNQPSKRKNLGQNYYNF